MKIASIGIHPAYWHEGHGEAMAKWCVALADMNKVPMSVSASLLGTRLFEKLGFEQRIEYIRFTDCPIGGGHMSGCDWNV